MKIRLRFFVLVALLNCFYVAGNATHKTVPLYYHYINKAELAIVDSAFLEALIYYSEAFTFKFPNDKDLENAFIIACIQKDTQLARKFINQLALQGWAFYNVSGHGHSYPPYLDTNFVKSINQDCDSLFQIAKRSLPVNMRYWSILYEEDQRVRNTGDVNDPIIRSIARATDSLNMLFSLLLIQDRGFPSFEKTGYFFDDSGQVTNIAYSSFFLLYWHQRGASVSVIDSVVLQAVATGDFRPDLWMVCNKYRSGAKHLYGLDFEKENYTNEEIARINDNRKSRMLEPFPDFVKKAKYQKANLGLYAYPQIKFYDNFLFIPG